MTLNTNDIEKIPDLVLEALKNTPFRGCRTLVTIQGWGVYTITLKPLNT